MSTAGNCCCNDKTLTRNLGCANCHTKWSEPMPSHERMGQCPQHHSSIAICGGSARLCEKCTNEGYDIKQTGWFNYEVTKK